MSLERAADGSLHVYGPLRVEHLYVNGTLQAPAGVWVGDVMNLDTFLGSLVLKSKPQTIYGECMREERVERWKGDWEKPSGRQRKAVKPLMARLRRCVVSLLALHASI